MQQAGEGEETGAVAPEAPNPKLQAPKKSQAPNFKRATRQFGFGV
jgi:hypothetical protein